MQAISVELLLAENDFMSDLLETERGVGGGGGLHHCGHGKFTALKQHALTLLKARWFEFNVLEAKVCSKCSFSF